MPLTARRRSREGSQGAIPQEVIAMHMIPQATYAAKRAERGVGAGMDSAVRTGTFETIHGGATQWPS